MFNFGYVLSVSHGQTNRVNVYEADDVLYLMAR